MRQVSNKMMNDKFKNSLFQNEDIDITNPMKFANIKGNKDEQITMKFPPKQRKQKSRPKTHYSLLMMYSKLHFSFGLSYDALFLAVDLLNQYLKKQSKKKTDQDHFLKIGMACFMIALKYEEVYPPSLNKIKAAFKLQHLTMQQYLDLEIEILEKLEHELYYPSPTRYFSWKQRTPELSQIKKLNKKDLFQVYLFLELAIMTPNIYCIFDSNSTKGYNWEQILGAINLLLSPLINQKQEDFDVVVCSKKLIIAKTNLENNHRFLFKKYQTQNYGCASITFYNPKTIFQNEDKDNNEKIQKIQINEHQP